MQNWFPGLLLLHDETQPNAKTKLTFYCVWKRNVLRFGSKKIMRVFDNLVFVLECEYPKQEMVGYLSVSFTSVSGFVPVRAYLFFARRDIHMPVNIADTACSKIRITHFVSVQHQKWLTSLLTPGQSRQVYWSRPGGIANISYSTSENEFLRGIRWTLRDIFQPFSPKWNRTENYNDISPTKFKHTRVHKNICVKWWTLSERIGRGIYP